MVQENKHEKSFLSFDDSLTDFSSLSDDLLSEDFSNSKKKNIDNGADTKE